MELVGIMFQTIAALLGLLASAILCWVNKEKSHSNTFLLLLLVTLTLLNINGVLYYTRWLLYIPWWHKITQPVAMLVAPLAFLYTRSVLRHEYRFMPKDLFLLLPFLLVLINFIPYYFLPLDAKKNYLLQFYQSSALKSSESEGFLPEYSLSFIRVIWSFTFIFLNFRLLRNFKKTASQILLSNNAPALEWLKQLNIMLMALTLIALAASVMAPLIKTNYNMISLALGSFVLVICIHLFTRPGILYGIFAPVETTGHFETTFSAMADAEITTTPITLAIPANDPDMAVMSHAETLRYKKIIEQFFAEKQPFLQVDYSLEQLVTDTGIPRTILSAFINREYGMGFREFLNRYRVSYLVQHINRPEWEQFTIEAIALECGFGNRNTFFKNFKQITGKAPSEFIKTGRQQLSAHITKTPASKAFVRFDTSSGMK